jgi:hypothetical protein
VLNIILGVKPVSFAQIFFMYVYQKSYLHMQAGLLKLKIQQALRIVEALSVNKNENPSPYKGFLQFFRVENAADG